MTSASFNPSAACAYRVSFAVVEENGLPPINRQVVIGHAMLGPVEESAKVGNIQSIEIQFGSFPQAKNGLILPRSGFVFFDTWMVMLTSQGGVWSCWPSN